MVKSHNYNAVSTKVCPLIARRELIDWLSRPR